MPRRYLKTSRGVPLDMTGKRMLLALEEELERPSKCDGGRGIMCLVGDDGKLVEGPWESWLAGGFIPF